MTRGIFAAAATSGAALWLGVVAMAAGGPRQTTRARVDFMSEIAPIVKRDCLECHSQDRRKGGLSLATYGDALDGGRNGAVIRPGNGAGSPIIHRLTGALDPQMPKDADPLQPAEIALIQRWIDEGARETPDGPAAPPPWEAPTELQRPALPAIVWRDWSSPIDRVVASYLDAGHAAEPAAVPMRSSRGAPISTSGGCCRRPRSCRRSSRIELRRSAQALVANACSPTTAGTPSTGSRSGTICCATKTASRTFPRPRGARASPTGCCPRCRPTCPTTSS